ncbi:HET domain-containing protein, partial [Aspergillus ruber CBS 135680]
MIRLLPHKNKDVPIECKLFNYALSQKDGRGHLYEALSYVWETDIKSHSIILDGCTFPVTSNLHAALINLRDDQIDRVLWVDAISINQLDQDEKSKQIPLMRTIYAQAMHVIVWLGEAMEDGDKALEGIRCLGAEQDI